MFVHVKRCWWHTARDNLSIDHKMYLFYEQLLGVHYSGFFFFLIKSENSLMHGLFHNCSFMHKLLIISCTGTCPVCAVNMSVHLMTAFP